MRVSRPTFLKRTLAGVLLASALVCPAVMAGPMEIVPLVVEGKLLPYNRVKKYNTIWYPASVVGYRRGMNFSYDYATRKLYVNGVETYIKALVVDDTVYVNMTPEVTQADMRPGMSTLANQEAQLKAFEGASPHMEGNFDALMMSQNTPTHEHPWMAQEVDRTAPIIDLDATGEAALAPHMRPGARPAEAAPAALPSRLPPPSTGGAPVTNEQGTVQVMPPEAHSQGMPNNVTTQGGPVNSSTVAPQSVAIDKSGLQPIPVAPQAQPDTSPFSSSGHLKATSGQNSVFRVSVTGGNWNAGDDGVLHLKLSQSNLSQVAQSNLGSFAVRCADGSRVEASRTRSYLPDGTLAPGSLREGELVFRLTQGRKPRTLELEGALGLSVPLAQL